MAIVHVSAENFEEEVVRSEVPVIVDFWADWCGPCKMQMPILDELLADMPDLKVAKINVDEQPSLATQFRVMSIPTLMAVKNGEVTSQAVGVQSKEALKNMLNQ